MRTRARHLLNDLTVSVLYYYHHEGERLNHRILHVRIRRPKANIRPMAYTAVPSPSRVPETTP